MPSSALLLAGIVAVAAAAALLLATRRLRHEVETTRRLLDRVRVAVGEAERVGQARGQLGGAGRVVAGIPYAILVGLGRRRR